MRKKIFASLLVIAALSAACYFYAQGKEKAYQQSEIRLLNDLLARIFYSEIMYKDVKWALDYIESFDREKNWENLLLARAAVSLAVSDIKKQKLPDKEMTDDDYARFMARGIDVNFMANEASSFDGEKTSLLNTCGNLNNSVTHEVFLKGDWEISMRHSDTTRKLADSYIQYLAHTADWVLATLSDRNITENFSGILSEHCPETHANQTKNPETVKNIEDSIHETLNKIESLYMESTKILGAKRDRLNIIQDALEKKNFALIRDDLMTISNMPPLVAAPKWFDGKDIIYFWREDGKIIQNPSPRAKLPGVPDGFLLRASGVTPEQVKEYQKELSEYGLRFLGSREDDRKISMLYETGGSDFAIFWEDGTAKIITGENHVCLVPVLYLSLMPAK